MCSRIPRGRLGRKTIRRRRANGSQSKSPSQIFRNQRNNLEAYTTCLRLIICSMLKPQLKSRSNYSSVQIKAQTRYLRRIVRKKIGAARSTV